MEGQDVNHVIDIKPAPATRPCQRLYQPMAAPGPNYSERQLFQMLLAFCLEFGKPRCFADWPEKLLREYLLFHLRARTLVWVREDLSLQDKYRLRPILGMGIICPTWADWIEEATRTQTCVFQWDRPSPVDAIYICEVITRPGPKRGEILKCLARTLWVRFPQWRELPRYYSRQDRAGRWESKRLAPRLVNWAGLPQAEEVHCG